ncbi:hypothetical protein IF650_01570 [Cellulosimicrobium terreum]|nr:hypothetical protein [Cellulosimicrobium terreum]
MSLRTFLQVLGAALAVIGVVQALIADSRLQLVLGILLSLCGVGQVVAAAFEKPRDGDGNVVSGETRAPDD